MKKAIIAACIISSLLIILTQFGFFEAAMMFWLAGVIPGTSYSIPSHIMYGLIVISISIVIIRLLRQLLFKFFFENTAKTTQTQPIHKKRLPKRRFSQI